MRVGSGLGAKPIAVPSSHLCRNNAGGLSLVPEKIGQMKMLQFVHFAGSQASREPEAAARVGSP
jgi:hypothetical protein